MIKEITKEEAIALWSIGAVVSPSFQSRPADDWDHCYDCLDQVSKDRNRHDTHGEVGGYDCIGLYYCGPCQYHTSLEELSMPWTRFFVVDIPENEE